MASWPSTATRIQPRAIMQIRSAFRLDHAARGIALVLSDGRREPAVRRGAKWRLKVFAVLLLVWGGLLFGRLVELQVLRHDTYTAKAHTQQQEEMEIAAPRGSIFDRTGQLLAESVPMDSIYIDPLHAPDLSVASQILSGVLNLDRGDLFRRMQWYLNNHRGYMWIAHRIMPEQAARLRSLKLDWIRFATESKRNYPRHALASQVIGAVDGEENGNSGVEMSLENELHGLPGAVEVLVDAKGRAIDSHVETEPRPGVSLTLAVDERIQFVAEHEIARAVEATHAASGSVVVMDPNTGDLLAMASYPTFDPNQPPTRGEGASARSNHAVSVPFEPGSVFKVITLSAALETTDLTPDSPINCGNGVLALPGRVVHEAHGGYGVMPMAMVLAKSSNIGAIRIGMRVGQERLYEYVRRFGFGSRTTVPLPAESPGMVRKLSRWGATSLSSVAMGHEVGVTTVQLAQACSAVANGGLLVHPRLILRKGDQALPAAQPQRILKPSTAITMRHMMEGVVLFGTGRRYANLQGYSSAGKTGSAQIYDFAEHHYTHIYNASFMGFAPVANPAIVVVVTVNATHGGSAGFGGPVAGPVFRAVAQEALRVLDVPKDLPDTPLDETGAPKKGAADDLAIADLGSTEPNILEEANQPADAPAEPAAVVQTAKFAGPAVPNFAGLTKRAVVALAEARGIPVLLVGEGAARAQVPVAGAALHPGERIRVEFVK
jgi:cell division protein FtsI (penicillin-binding protein 3)